jgi:hypothetical protein
MRTFSLTIATCLILAGLITGCGGKQTKKISADPLALLQQGSYQAARLAAEARGGNSPTDRAVIALSHVAEHPDAEAAGRAVKALAARATEAESIAAASEMLAILSDLPALRDEERATLCAEIALGATGRGPFATAEQRANDAEPKARTDLAIAILERLRAIIAGAAELQTARILTLWNGCFTLTGGAMTGADDLQSWRLYACVAGLAVAVEAIAPTSDLAEAVLSSAVAAVEASPLLSVAVRCDLSSPFDALRAALSRKRDLGARLERAVEKSLGCSRGQYAPKPQ